MATDKPGRTADYLQQEQGYRGRALKMYPLGLWSLCAFKNLMEKK